MTRKTRNFRSAALLALTALSICSGTANADVLFELQDPKGDDDGSGALLYPTRDDLQPGDLDLVRFSAEERTGGVWFVLEMAQPIRDPAGRVTEIGQTAVDRLARNGFYTLNVDIYVDTDRVAGSGQTNSVPGRGVAIDRGYAWEKCIVLTPRPDIARTMLQMTFDDEFEAELRARQGKVSKQDSQELQRRSELRVSDLYYFPTKVRVAGRRIEFLVPTDFLGGVPSRAWGYTALVTGADIEQTGRPVLLGSSKNAMMTMTVARGARYSQFGIRGDADEATPPVVDILSSGPQVQATALSDYDTVAGRLAAIPGVAPDGNVAVAPSGEVLTPEQASRIESTAGADAGSVGAPVPAERRTVPARLRTLNQLLADGLITEAEYNDLRRKILAEL